MSKPLKILHLEDLEDDAQMVDRALRKSGLSFEMLHVENKEQFIKGLQEFSPDIIISDHSLPSFDSHEALQIVKEMGIGIPFILVTATVSEEYAVSIIREGACDYILKDRLQRLSSAITGAMDKYLLEQEKKRSDENIRASQRKYKLLFESNPMPMWMLSRSTLNIIAVNEAALSHYGYSREEFLQLNAKDLRPAEDIDKFIKHINAQPATVRPQGAWRHRKKDGTIIMVDVIAHDLVYEGNPVRLVLANDITEKLKAEAELAEQREHQQKLITETSILVQERERDEIGKELHDNINQILASAKLYADIVAAKETPASEALQKARENISLAISEIRKLSHTLVAPSLGNVTLEQAVEELFTDIRTATSLRLEFIKNNFKEVEIKKEINLMIFRIIQEQINNVIKHAKAKNIVIELSALNDEIILAIKDDGIGFDSMKATNGIGLRNIRNRVEFFDGMMRIDSIRGKGCVLKVVVPWKRTVELVHA